MLQTVTRVLSGVLLVLASAGFVEADAFTNTYSGSLTTTSSVLEETFSLTSISNVLVTTTSYGGGSNLDSTSTLPGGFQPSVTLYTASGSYVASQAVSSTRASVDPSTDLALDALLSDSNLTPGGYIVTLTNWLEQQPPTATNLSDGFVNYGGSTFLDAGNNLRLSNYALNLSVTCGAAATPEPTTIGLFTIEFLLIAVIGRKSFVSDQR